MRTSDFDFALPPELIAQHPTPQRDASRLLVLYRNSGTVEHRQFRELPTFLRAGDVLILNNSRVIPARLRAQNISTGGQFEILLVEENATNDWWVMLRPGKRARVGTRMRLRDRAGQATEIIGTVTDINAEGHRRLQFSGTDDLFAVLDSLGETPLPPYIRRDETGEAPEDRARYQTVFAAAAGSVAAPTAGLHFTPELLARLRGAGVEVGFVTLHVGLGTFAPVKSDTLAGHVMHEERYEISARTAALVNEAKRTGRRVIAIGTTSVRVLESAAQAALVAQASLPVVVEQASLPASTPTVLPPVELTAVTGRTRIFIYPSFNFRIVDALVTNFHLPQSTLLMLVSAFAAPGETCGRETVLHAYAEAIRQRYRFFSYGDAMLLL
jgi:S-adenosylmethionine:tRNA ribosyltransferase-isomerase